jgi:hypothetical protein
MSRALADTECMAELPIDLTGPIGLELARAVEQLPGEPGMPGARGMS